ncbi:thiamine pyrophosphate-binding protein [Alphaproteobacteria bacterium HT1-32]|nr:thiamine pyrophosphate-binding protein [Alphaproteobacteria bacterium HT1-32]
MENRTNARTGAQLLVDTLLTQEVRQVFCVPGESYLSVLDAFVDAPDIDVTVCRQEGGASMMADAYGKLTGEPGICFVTRGPGAANAAAGLHIARQDSTPMILFIGQVGRNMIEREAFQEVDYRRMFGQMAKWVAEIDDPARVPEYVSRAFHTATSGRPGPVVLALPEDMLAELAPGAQTVGRYRRAEAAPTPDDLTELRDLLSAAKHPFMILGGGGWDANVKAAMEKFAADNGLPVAVSFRRQDYFDNSHPNFGGDVGIHLNPDLSARIKKADLLLVVGARMSEKSSADYTLIGIPEPDQKLIHIHADPHELGRVYRPTLGIAATARGFANAVAEMKPVSRADEDVKALHDSYLVWNTKLPVSPGPVQMGDIMAWLGQHLPEDAIVCNGAGNYATWVHRFRRFTRYKSQLAPTSGSMGYGVPAAIAAKRTHPERTVVAFAGDGCFLMTGQELATAVQYKANVIIIVVNNGMYGTIRMHQERDYPGRISATQLTNPDFAKLADAYGGHGEVVARTEDFGPAFERAQASGKPSVIEVRIDPEAITISASLSQIRDRALAARG